jgi:hypothetical protein
MGVNVEVDNGKSHVDRPLKVSWEGTSIAPFLEELVVEINPVLDLSEVGPPPHLPEEIPLVELEGLALLKIRTGLDRPDPKTEFREPVTISIGDRKGNFPLHCYIPFNCQKTKQVDNLLMIVISYRSTRLIRVCLSPLRKRRRFSSKIERT